MNNHDNITGQAAGRIVPVGRTELLMGVHKQGAVRVENPVVSNGVKAQMTLQPSSLDENNQPHGAISAVVMDHVLAAALRSQTQQLGAMATTQLHFDVLRPLPVMGSTLQAHGSAKFVGECGGFATSIVCDDNGTELARGSGWFAEVSDGGIDARTAFTDRLAHEIDYSENGSLASTLNFNISRTLGTDVCEWHSHEACFDEQLEMLNENGTLHGGAISMMGVLAAESSMPDRSLYSLQSVQVDFLRGATGAVKCKTRQRRMGRRFRSVEVQVEASAGVVAVVSCGFRAI